MMLPSGSRKNNVEMERPRLRRALAEQDDVVEIADHASGHLKSVRRQRAPRELPTEAVPDLLYEIDADRLLDQILLQQIAQHDAQERRLVGVGEDFRLSALHEDQAWMELPARIEAAEVRDIVRHEDHAVVDGVARDMLIRRGAQIDLVHMNRVEAPIARKSNQSGAQVLVDEQLELVGPARTLFFKA
jgi:hypothetical protein